MELNCTKSVSDLADDQKRSLETLLGSSLEPNQQVLILTYQPSELAANDARRAARERIAQTLQINQRFAQENGVTDAEADEAISEAIEQTRRRN